MDQERLGSRVSNLEAQLCSQEVSINRGVEKKNLCGTVGIENALWQ